MMVRPQTPAEQIPCAVPLSKRWDSEVDIMLQALVAKLTKGGKWVKGDK